MSDVHWPNRKSTDFTIARILSDDRIENSKLRDINSIMSYSPLERVLCATNSDSNRCCLLSDYPNRNNLSKSPHKFSEDKIINSTSTRKIFHGDEEIKKKFDISSPSTAHSTNDLYWLQCTRYRPPKLPRKSLSEKTSRRRSATHPRIPFTSCQLQVLEDKYKSGAYLSRKDVTQLSMTLRLSNSRIKIWFQNRRARDRRETKVTSSFPTDCKDNL